MAELDFELDERPVWKKLADKEPQPQPQPQPQPRPQPIVLPVVSPGKAQTSLGIEVLKILESVDMTEQERLRLVLEILERELQQSQQSQQSATLDATEGIATGALERTHSSIRETAQRLKDRRSKMKQTGRKKKESKKKKPRSKTKKKTRRKKRRKSRNKTRKKYKNIKTLKGIYSKIKLSGGAPPQGANSDPSPRNDAYTILVVILHTLGQLLYLVLWKLPEAICLGFFSILGCLNLKAKGIWSDAQPAPAPVSAAKAAVEKERIINLISSRFGQEIIDVRSGPPDPGDPSLSPKLDERSWPWRPAPWGETADTNYPISEVRFEYVPRSAVSLRAICDYDPKNLAYWESLLNGSYHNVFIDIEQGGCMGFVKDIRTTPQRKARGIKVLGVENIENQARWDIFWSSVVDGVDRNKNLQRGQLPPETISQIKNEMVRQRREMYDSHVLTNNSSRICSSSLTKGQIDSINMVDVWHGCDPINIKNIEVNGFDASKAGSGVLYGPGIYFTPQACKALDYCVDIRKNDDRGSRSRNKACPSYILKGRDARIEHCRNSLTYVYEVGDAVIFVGGEGRDGRNHRGRSARVIGRKISPPQTEADIRKHGRVDHREYRIRFMDERFNTKTIFANGADQKYQCRHNELTPHIRIYCIAHSSVIMGNIVPTSGAVHGAISQESIGKIGLTDRSKKLKRYASIMAIGGVTQFKQKTQTQIHHEFVSMAPSENTYLSHVIWFTIN